MMVGSEVIFSFWWVGSVFVSNYICLWYQLRITVGKPIYRKTPSSFKSHIGFPVCLSQSYRYTEISNTVYRDFSIYWNFRHTEIIEVTTFFNERHSILLESVNLSLYYTIRVTACLSKSFDKDIYIDILSYCNDHHRALYYKTETSHSRKYKAYTLRSIGPILYPGECDLMVHTRTYRVVFSWMHFVTFVNVYNIQQDTKLAQNSQCVNVELILV